MRLAIGHFAMPRPGVWRAAAVWWCGLSGAEVSQVSHVERREVSHR